MVEQLLEEKAVGAPYVEFEEWAAKSGWCRTKSTTVYKTWRSLLNNQITLFLDSTGHIARVVINGRAS